jgi:hypothetical protein
MRLSRPYIPLAVRVEVAERQCRECGLHPQIDVRILKTDTLGARLKRALLALSAMAWCQRQRLELHHRPALVNRRRKRNGEYDPPANDPFYLVYLPKKDHDIETRVRGVGAQRSDLSQRRYLKKVARNRDTKRRKYKWPKRRF